MLIEEKDGNIFIVRKYPFNGKTHEVKIGHFPSSLLHSEIPNSIVNNITVLESVELVGYMEDHTAKRLHEDLLKGMQIVVKSLKDSSYFRMKTEEVQHVYDLLDGARRQVAKLYKKPEAVRHPEVVNSAT